MKSIASRSLLRPFGWCVVLLVLGSVLSGCARNHVPRCTSLANNSVINCVNGRGEYIFANGAIYTGEWKDSKQHGQGTYSFASGAEYVGEYRDGERNGQGIYTYANGDSYVGEYRNGKRHGQGTFTYANGNSYVGEYRN